MIPSYMIISQTKYYILNKKPLMDVIILIFYKKNRPKSGKQPNSRHNSVVAITGNINHEEFGM